MKKFLAVLLSLVMVLSLFGPAAVALEEDAAPVEPAEAVVEAAEEKLELPEIEETVTDEEPAAEEPAAEEAAEEDAEAVAPEAPAEAKEPEAEEPAEEPAEEEAEAELPEEAPVEEAVPEEEEAIEKEETTPVVIPTKFEKELDNVTVTAETKAGAFSVPVELQVKPLTRTSSEYKEADELLAEEGYAYDGMLAFDIGFVDADGAPVEPEGDVSVSLKLKTGGIVPDNAESALVAHITEDGVEPVADTDEVTPGIVSLEVNALSADFVVDSFSTFVITWTNAEEEEETATIHFVTMDGGDYTEIAEDAKLDTTAASISLENNFSGYYFTGASYKETESSNAVAIDTVLKKVTADDGSTSWTMTQISVDEDGNKTTQTVTVAPNSQIYSIYAEKGSGGYTPPAPPTDESQIQGPTTEKTVTPNGDGTYKIRLDITGVQEHIETKVGANVIVVFDTTNSMSGNMSGGGTRIAAAKSALQTLVNTLKFDENEIHFALAEFNVAGNQSYIKTWDGANWTTEDDPVLTYAQSNQLNYRNTHGTNWELGLDLGLQLVGEAQSDADMSKNGTYVIFMTDGEPNRWDGYNYGANNFEHVAEAVAAAQDEANQLGGSSKLYGIFCGASSGYDNLEGLIEAAQGVDTINATSTSAIQEAFENIGKAILEDIGAEQVSVDDGIPSLSSVSSAVAGEASGYKYYKNGEEWADAPGASYSNDNGVTWDLSDVGKLEFGTTYSIEFDVWPSQAAYDKIADLNNNLITMSDEELAEAGIGKNADGTYYLKTNTHLETTYTVNGETYSDNPDYSDRAMALPTEPIRVEKKWYNKLDGHDGTVVKLDVTKDGDPYLYGDNALEVSEASGWKSEDVYISMGQIKGTGSNYEVLEDGHDYEVVEPPEFTWRWELTSEVYHPMVINGTPTVLIKDENATGTEGTDYYVIDGAKYKVGTGENLLTAVNNRRSWLQLEKAVTGEGADPDALFKFTITVTDPNDEDVWFSVYGPDGIVKDLTTNATPEEGDTGYFHAASGSSITVEIKAGWTLRFTNLRSDTTYTIEETTLPDGFQFVSAAGRAVSQATEEANQDEPEVATVTGMTAEGTINVPNAEFYVDFNNKYEETEIEITKIWEDNGDQIGSRPDTTEFADYINLLQAGEVTEDYDDAKHLTITDNGDDTYTIKYTGLPKYVNNEEVEYTIKEKEAPEGYTASTTEAVEDGGEITNTLKVGNLTIKKTVVSPSATDKETKYTFTITTDPSVNGSFEATGVDSITSVTFTNGEATVELADGEELTIVGLAEGVECTVTEEPVQNLTPDKTEVTVTISETEAAEAAFTNTRALGDLEVKKTVTSSTTADKSIEFEFTVTLSDKTVSGTFGDMTFDEGVATFKLTDGQSAKAEGLPQGVTYTVTEKAVDGFTTEKTGDTGSISDTPATAEFTNKRSEGALTVKKTVESPAESDKSVKFTFTITLSDKTITETYSGVEFKEGVATVELADGEEKTIEGLPQGVTYTVEEEPADNFETKATGDTGTIGTSASTAAFTNTRELGDLEVTKTVVSSTTADKSVKFSFTVTLSDNTVSGTFGDMTFDEGVATFELTDGQTAKAEGLPQGVTYTVEETAADGFTTEKDGDTGTISDTAATAAFTNTRDEGKLTVKKTVVSDLDEDKTVKFEFTITLSDKTITETYSGVEFEEGVATIELADGEEKTIEGLPADVTYEVVETANDAYETEKTGDTGTIVKDETATAEFTNTRKMIKVTITKVWEDEENKYGVRPDDVTVQLLADEEVSKSDPVTEDDEWTITYEVPEYTTEGDKIVYDADEEQVKAGYVKEVTGDATEGFTITNTFEPQFGDPPVGKTVEGEPRRDETFTFKMVGSSTTDTVPMPEGVEGNEMTMEIVGTGADEFGEFALVEPGTYTYEISEVPGSTEGYNEGYDYDDTVYTVEFEITTDENNALVKTTKVNGEVVDELTAQYVMFTNVFEEPTVDISGTKTWDDADDQDGKRPESITINLLADGEKVDSVTVTEADDWKFEFKGVPKYNDDFEEIEYTVTEETVDGYETEIKDFDVTNTHEPEEVDVSVAKVWDDNDDQDGKRPDSITVTLSNGDKVTLSEENEWKATITGLPKYEKGEEIEYTWTEASVDGYELTDTKVEEYLTTLTNTHEPEVTKVDVTKVWTDADDKDGIRPDSVTINLLADGKETGASVTLNEGNSWKGSFINLPKYADGKEIEYTISEVTVEGYTTTISGDAASGFTVTNVHVPDETPPTGDSNMLGLWIALLSVSALGFCAILKPRKRRNGAN